MCVITTGFAKKTRDFITVVSVLTVIPTGANGVKFVSRLLTIPAPVPTMRNAMTAMYVPTTFAAAAFARILK